MRALIVRLNGKYAEKKEMFFFRRAPNTIQLGEYWSEYEMELGRNECKAANMCKYACVCVWLYVFKTQFSVTWSIYGKSLVKDLQKAFKRIEIISTSRHSQCCLIKFHDNTKKMWIERFEYIRSSPQWATESVCCLVHSIVEDTKRISNKLFGRLCCSKTRVQWSSGNIYSL